MNKNHEPTIWTRIGNYVAGNTPGVAALAFASVGLAFLIAGAIHDASAREAQRAAQQACVLHGKVPAEVYGKIVCIAPEALR